MGEGVQTWKKAASWKQSLAGWTLFRKIIWTATGDKKHHRSQLGMEGAGWGGEGSGGLQLGLDGVHLALDGEESLLEGHLGLQRRHLLRHCHAVVLGRRIEIELHNCICAHAIQTNT